GAEAGIEAELERELVVDAGPAEKEQHAVAEALFLDQLDEGSGVLLVAVALRDDLADEDGVGADLARDGRELLVFDLRAEVVHLEALVAFEALVAAVAFVVEDRVDADGVRVASGAGTDDDE